MSHPQYFDADGNEVNLDNLLTELRSLTAAEARAADARVAALVEEVNTLGPAAFMARQAERAVVAEAEEAVAGIRRVTVAVGDCESDDDMQRRQRLTDAFWSLPGTVRLIGTNDTLTFVFGPPAAGRSAMWLAKAAHNLNPGWWKVA